MTNNSLTYKLANRFRKGTFLHNLSIVMTGTAVAQLISFAMMPVVSRLFTPADFGVYGSFNAVLSVLTAAVTLQYAQAIILPSKKEEGIGLFVVSCLSVVIVTAIVSLTVILFSNLAKILINAPSGWFLLLLLFELLVVGLNQTLQAWCVRVKSFKTTAISQIIRSISAITIWIAAGFGQMGAMGLVIGSILAESLAGLNLWRIGKRDLKENRNSVTWVKIKKLAHVFRDFPLFAAPQHVMNALSQGLPVLLLAYFYGIGVAGAYAFGIRILQAPMDFILTPLRQVLFQKASETYNQAGDLWHLFFKATGGLMAVAIVPCAITFIWAPQIFSWIFGNEWQEAGLYARWLLLWMFVAFANVPSVLFARIMRQQRNLFVFELSGLLMRTAFLFFGGLYWAALTTVIFFSIAGFILNIFLIIWVGALVYAKPARGIRVAT